MPTEKYIRFENGQKEYYDLKSDPYEVESDPGSVPPKIRSYWERRIDAIGSCSGAECRTAEDAPALPAQP